LTSPVNVPVAVTDVDDALSSFASPVIEPDAETDAAKALKTVISLDVTVDTVIEADNSIGSDPCDAKAAEANA
jgi:hypothetical protein